MSEHTSGWTEDWAPLVHGLRTRFDTGDFTTGLALVNEFADAAQAANHHPEITLRYASVDVLLTSEDVRRVTERDHALAARLTELARARSIPARPLELSVIQLGLDTADAAAIVEFWAAVLDARIVDEEITLQAANALIWFQPTEPHAVPRQRFHLDVWVDPRAARERVNAALAAGGRLVSDAAAPAFWVLADQQGNHACVCTVGGVNAAYSGASSPESS